MPNCWDSPVLYRYGREGRDACWSSLSSSLNHYANWQKSELCLPRPRLSSSSACDSSKYAYKRNNCEVNQPRCRSVSRGASPNLRTTRSPVASNRVSASNGGGAAASQRKNDPIKTPPPQPQPPKSTPPPLERRSSARCYRSASTSRRPMNVQSPDQAPVADDLCSSKALCTTPTKSSGPKQDAPLVVGARELFSESECNKAKKIKCAVVPPADLVAEQAKLQLASGVKVTSNHVAANDSSTKFPVKTSAANPEVIVTNVDEIVTCGDKKTSAVDKVVTALDAMKTTVEERSVTSVNNTVPAVDKTETAEVLTTVALNEPVNSVEELVMAPDEILIALNKTLAAAEATMSAAQKTVTNAVEEKMTAAEEMVTVVNDTPKLTASSPLCLGDENDIHSAEVFVVPNEAVVCKPEESLVVDNEYEKKIKEIDEKIVSYSKSFISAVLLYVFKHSIAFYEFVLDLYKFSNYLYIFTLHNYSIFLSTYTVGRWFEHSF